MSAETAFVAALDAYAPLVSLVGSNISKNAVGPDAPLPLVVFSAVHDPLLGLDASTHATQSTFTVETWARDGDDAAQVADEITAALVAFNAVQTSAIATVIGRTSLYDGELKLDGEVLTVEWWTT